MPATFLGIYDQIKQRNQVKCTKQKNVKKDT